ncbi:hypothetical protein MMC07_008260 [Pseudocyphellaria aurata]|nr:hypothetical protein [Pseudocyphellaria aurata]
MTRRLDYTYYSLLQHISVLATLTSSLATLGSTTSQHHEHFSKSTSSLARTFNAQISGFDQTFGAQAERIDALETRLQEGWTRVGELGQRLENVRARVEESERGEREWQGRARRRVRMLWAGMSSLLAIFLVVLLVHHWPRGESSLVPPLTLPPACDTKSQDLQIDDVVKNVAIAAFPATIFESQRSLALATSQSPHTAPTSSSASTNEHNQIDDENDAVLRLFDEL